MTFKEIKSRAQSRHTKKPSVLAHETLPPIGDDNMPRKPEEMNREELIQRVRTLETALRDMISAIGLNRIAISSEKERGLWRVFDQLATIARRAVED